MSLERLGVGTYKTTCAADTEYFGELIAPCLEDGDVLILTGGLGVGKTHFTKGVSRGLGDGHMVTSLRSPSWPFTIKVVFRCFTLIYTAWSMPTSSRIRAFSMCWAMRVLACWNGANNSRTS